MERARRIAAIWSWLPAFRAVAESQHLPTAASDLHVSASALSRSIGELEHHLGRRLFDRVGRRLQLNAAGEEMLRAVRTAMRSLDEGLAAATDDTPHGPFHLAGAAPLTAALFLPVAAALGERHPRIVPHLHEIPDRQAVRGLLRGSIDLAIVAHVIPATDGVIVEHLVDLACAVCVAPGTGAHGLRAALPGDLGEEPVSLVALRLQGAVDAARAGYAVTLPIALARRAGLVIIGECERTLPIAVHRRAPLAGAAPAPAETVIEMIRPVAAALASER